MSNNSDNQLDINICTGAMCVILAEAIPLKIHSVISDIFAADPAGLLKRCVFLTERLKTELCCR